MQKKLLNTQKQCFSLIQCLSVLEKVHKIQVLRCVRQQNPLKTTKTTEPIKISSHFSTVGLVRASALNVLGRANSLRPVARAKYHNVFPPWGHKLCCTSLKPALYTPLRNNVTQPHHFTNKEKLSEN